ncbi:MAG: glycosyltransferase family 9 protein, partial [Candidatus Pacebacteria bacterium]|nr:glycosyltransferase family 9 protein [Candidatus Paceibacterota bacterium]
GIHDVDQNMNLLKIFGLNPDNEERKLTFYISEEDKKFAEDFLKKNHLENDSLVGIHPGAGGAINKNWQGFSKRWPEENFIKLCDKLIEEKSAKILIFGGPEEIELKNKIRNLSNYKENITLINKSLKHSAAIIQRCNLFISNDSGLMHIATVFNVPTIGIFGPSDYKRTTPYGENSYIVRKDLPCSPCLKYPFHLTSSKIKCKRNFECLKDITVKDVIDEINEIKLWESLASRK